MVKLHINQLILGSWCFGAEGFGHVHDEQSATVIQRAVDAGITTIDTAPAYGWGHAESLLGRVLKPIRERVSIISKCGLIKTGREVRHNLSPKQIMVEADETRHRLQSDYIDCYMPHWPDPDVSVEHTMEALLTLKSKDVIHRIGFSNHSWELLDRAEKIGGIDCVQCPYSLINKGQSEQIMIWAKQKSIEVQAYGLLEGGLICRHSEKGPGASKKDIRRRFYQWDDPEKIRFIQKEQIRLRETLGELSAPLIIEQSLLEAPIDRAVIGVRNKNQLEDFLETLI